MARWAAIIKSGQDSKVCLSDSEKEIKGSLGLYLNSLVAKKEGGTGKVGILPSCGLALVRWGYEVATS